MTPRILRTVGIAAVSIIAIVVLAMSGPAPIAQAAAPSAIFFHCGLDHSATDDPVVHPGMPGMSHLHDFFGAQGLDAFSVPADFAGAPTTCNLGGTEGYIVPALYVDGIKVDPIRADAKWTADGKDESLIQPFPLGLVIVAGSKLPPASVGSRFVDWSCHPGGSPYHMNSDIEPCGPGELTSARVDFPDCWDGVNLDSPDHRSHMAYSNPNPTTTFSHNGPCPASHPVSLPEVKLVVSYDLPPGKVTLASGPSATWHADFFSSGDPQVQADLVERCIVERQAKGCNTKVK